MLSPTNRTKLYKYTNCVSREKKKAFRVWITPTGKGTRKTKNNKALKASDLRAFYKLDIIGN